MKHENHCVLLWLCAEGLNWVSWVKANSSFFHVHWHLCQPWAHSTALSRNCCPPGILKPPAVLREDQFYSLDRDRWISQCTSNMPSSTFMDVNQLSVISDSGCKAVSEAVGIQVMQLLLHDTFQYLSFLRIVSYLFLASGAKQDFCRE